MQDIEEFGKKFDALANTFIEGLYEIYRPSRLITSALIPLGLKRIEKEALEITSAIEHLLVELGQAYSDLGSAFPGFTPEQKRIRVERKKVEIYKDLVVLTERTNFIAKQQLKLLSEYDDSLRNKVLKIKLEKLALVTETEIWESWIEQTPLF